MGTVSLRLLIVSPAFTYREGQHLPSYHHQPHLWFLNRSRKMNLFLPDLRVLRRGFRILTNSVWGTSLGTYPYNLPSSSAASHDLFHLTPISDFTVVSAAEPDVLLFIIISFLWNLWCVISNCLFNIKVKNRISAGHKREGKKQEVLWVEGFLEDMEVKNIGTYKRHLWTSSLTNKPVKIIWKARQMGHYFDWANQEFWRQELFDTSDRRWIWQGCEEWTETESKEGQN